MICDMPIAPAGTAPAVSPAAKLAAYRTIAAAVQLGVSGVLALYCPWPWVVVAVPGALGWLIGKLLGVPLTDVTQQALTRMTPEHAVAVTVSALQSLPPAQVEAATTVLLGSLPPDARARASLVPAAPGRFDDLLEQPTTIQFVGGTDYPDARPNTAPPTHGGVSADDANDETTTPNKPRDRTSR